MAEITVTGTRLPAFPSLDLVSAQHFDNALDREMNRMHWGEVFGNLVFNAVIKPVFGWLDCAGGRCSGAQEALALAGAPLMAFALPEEAEIAATGEIGQVLIDSNIVPLLKKDPTLGGRLRAGEQAVVSYVTKPELRNAVAKGRGLRGAPRILDSLEVLTRRPSIDGIISFRGTLERLAGRFGDAIIGQQAVEFGIPLITNDAELARAVQAAGGVVR